VTEPFLFCNEKKASSARGFQVHLSVGSPARETLPLTSFGQRPPASEIFFHCTLLSQEFFSVKIRKAHVRTRPVAAIARLVQPSPHPIPFQSLKWRLLFSRFPSPSDETCFFPQGSPCPPRPSSLRHSSPLFRLVAGCFGRATCPPMAFLLRGVLRAPPSVGRALPGWARPRLGRFFRRRLFAPRQVPATLLWPFFSATIPVLWGKTALRTADKGRSILTRLG